MTASAGNRIVYCQGRFLPLEEATIPIMDRGFLFGDGIYEVSAVIDGRLVDNAAHLARLERSLKAIAIPNPFSIAEWTALQIELVARNGLSEGLVYLQVTRGVAERDFLSPPGLLPTVVMFTQAKTVLANPAFETGIGVITVPDIRWYRRDVKSTALLAQVLAKQAAQAAGVAEAWMVEDHHVTEGASSTAFIVTHGRQIVTRPLSHAILPGITRQAVLNVAKSHGFDVAERLFTVEEALHAEEAFITSASALAVPVVAINGHRVGNGRPGPVVAALRAEYLDLVRAGAG